MRIIVNKYLSFWDGLITNFVDAIRGWRVGYSIIFSIFYIIGSILPVLFPELVILHSLQGHIYLFFSVLIELLAILSIPIHILPFSKTFRGGKRFLSLSTHGDDISNIKKIFHQGITVLLMGLFLPVIFTAFCFSPVILEVLMLPHLTITQHLYSIHNLVGDIVASLLASLEESWRWSTIFVTLLIFKNLSKSKWTSQASYRRLALLLALTISSLLFGMMHLAEFSQNQLVAMLLLGVGGLILAFIAILTRRLWMAFTVHALYDFLIFSKFIGGYAVPYFIVLFLMGIVFVAILFWISYRNKVSVIPSTCQSDSY